MATRNAVNGISAIAKAIAEVTGAAETVGLGFVAQVCNTAKQYYKGKGIPSEDITSIVDKVAQLRKWPEGREGAAQRSRCKVLLENYAPLPEAAKLFAAKNNGRCNWHSVMTLARMLGKGKSPKQAAEALANPVVSTDPKDVKKSVAMSFKRMLKLKGLPPKLAKDLRHLAAEHNLSV